MPASQYAWFQQPQQSPGSQRAAATLLSVDVHAALAGTLFGLHWKEFLAFDPLTTLHPSVFFGPTPAIVSFLTHVQVRAPDGLPAFFSPPLIHVQLQV